MKASSWSSAATRHPWVLQIKQIFSVESIQNAHHPGWLHRLRDAEGFYEKHVDHFGKEARGPYSLHRVIDFSNSLLIAVMSAHVIASLLC